VTPPHELIEVRVRHVNQLFNMIDPSPETDDGTLLRRAVQQFFGRKAHFTRHGALGGILLEGLLIGGWVAMWRPLEIFLYDWWPIRAQARLFDRLADMPVTIQHTNSER